jgi:acyl-CoA thioesterase FadM
VVAEAHLRFLDAARFDEDIEIETAVTYLGTTSMRTHYRFLSNGKLLLTAGLRHVFVVQGTARKTPIPDWARAGLEQWLLPELDPAPAG